MIGQGDSVPVIACLKGSAAEALAADLAFRLGVRAEVWDSPALSLAPGDRFEAAPVVLLLDASGSEDVLALLDSRYASGRGLSCLILAAAADEATQEYFFQLGAAGVIAASAGPELLERAVRAVWGGELWMSRRLLSRLARQTALPAERRLTERESSILGFIREGLTNQQIADRLFISRETVRWHVRKLYAKIGVETRSAAIQKSAGAW